MQECFTWNTAIYLSRDPSLTVIVNRARHNGGVMYASVAISVYQKGFINFSGIRRRPILDGDAGTINFKLESRLLYNYMVECTRRWSFGLQKVDYQSVLLEE